MSSVNITAVEKAIKAAWPSIPAAYGPLIELVRVLAHQVDAAPEGPSSRLAASYLSALKDLSKILVAAPDTTKPLDELQQFLADNLHPRPDGVAS